MDSENTLLLEVNKLFYVRMVLLPLGDVTFSSWYDAMGDRCRAEVRQESLSDSVNLKTTSALATQEYFQNSLTSTSLFIPSDIIFRPLIKSVNFLSIEILVVNTDLFFFF